MGFERLEDVRKVQKVIAKRFARFGLKINEEKTRLVAFGRPPWGGKRPGSEPGSFDFLGFTHYWGKSRKGHQVVMKKTAGSRFRRTLRNIREWGWKHRHLSMKEPQRQINEKLRGHDAYFGVTGNFRMLSNLRCEVAKLWRKSWFAPFGIASPLVKLGNAIAFERAAGLGVIRTAARARERTAVR